MGYELRRWLADRLPAGLSSGERLVALEIADQAHEKTRRAYGRSVLEAVIRRTGYANEKQLGKVLGKLGANGIELRVPLRDKEGEIVVDSIGRTVYACNSRELNFYVPLAEECPALMVPRWGDHASSERSPAGGTNDADGPPPGPDGPPPGAGSSPAWSPKVPQAGDPSPQSPQENSSSLLSHERIVMDALARQGVTEEEMREVIKEIQRSTKVKIENPASYLRKVAERGDLVDYLNRVRAAADRRAAHTARQAASPPEPHPEADQPQVTPEERDSAIAAVRDLLRGTTTRRGAGGPARVVRPRTAPETPPEVERAHATLARHGNAFDLMDAARKRLGDQAHRNEVMVLAAELARAGVSSAAAGG